jgi:hypothetical protein
MATEEEEKARLAAACERLALEISLEAIAEGGSRADKTRAAKEFAAALFECRDELGDVAAILPTLCVPEETAGGASRLGGIRVSPDDGERGERWKLTAATRRRANAEATAGAKRRKRKPRASKP